MANVTRYKTTKGETRYRVRYRKPDGTQTDKRGFKRKIDAENWAAKRVTVAKAEGTYIDPAAGKTTVGELGPAWLAKKKLSTKPSHYRNLEGAWEKWVKPEWGNTPVSAVTRETAQQWVTGISQGKTVKDERGNEIVLAKPRSASVVLRAHGVPEYWTMRRETDESPIIPRGASNCHASAGRSTCISPPNSLTGWQAASPHGDETSSSCLDYAACDGANSYP